MKITSLEIDRFGIWENLSLNTLSKGLNVFYGPNEAGKTTLMQSIRSSLYGCAHDDRVRYIQMVLGSPPEGKDPTTYENDPAFFVGGSMTVDSSLGKHRIQRRYLRKNTSLYDRQNALEMKSGFVVTGGLATWSGRFYPLPGKGIAESVMVSGPDGARLSDYFVKTLINNVDESTFNNVFAIGLDELQRLGSLNETDAAQMLYRLSVGVDRVSLIQILQQLVDERNEIFDMGGKTTILEGLLAQRERMALKAQEPATHLREYSRLLGESRELKEGIRQLQEKIDKNNWQKRVDEIAQQVMPLWDTRKSLTNEIAGMGHVLVVEENVLAQSNLYVVDIKGTRDSLELLRRDYLKVKKELAALVVNPAIVQNAPRIEMLCEEVPRLTKLNTEIAEVTGELQTLQTQLDNEEIRLRGAKKGKMYLTRSTVESVREKVEPAIKEGEILPTLPEEASIREIEDYRIPAKAVVHARQKLSKQTESHKQVKDRLKEITDTLETGLTSRGQRNVSEALDATNDLVVSLKRRTELAAKLNELGQLRKELERQNAFCTNNLSMAPGPLLLIGLSVIAGVLLFAFSLLRKLTPELGIFGLVLALGAWLLKKAVDGKNHARLSENQRQLGLLLKQIEQVKQEAQVIDTRYPAPGQPADVRLQKALADLSYFEKLVPLDTQWKETHQHFQLMEHRLIKATANLKAAKKRWTQWLFEAGLPRKIKPLQIRELLERVDLVEELRDKIETLKNNLDLYRRERHHILEQLERVLLEVPLPEKEGKTHLVLIQLLKEQLEDIRRTQIARKEKQKGLVALLKQRRSLRRQERKERHEWLDFLQPYGATCSEELDELAARYLTYVTRTEKRANVNAQIQAGIGGFCAEGIIAKILDTPEERRSLPELLNNVIVRIKTLTEELREKLEHSGRLDEQLSALAAKKDSVRYQFDRSALERRINEMASLWQGRALACHLMEDIRKAYERERQPETLREASRFLHLLTGGQYIKIWTPLGEDTLFVDTSEGQTLDIGHLSRGTREQLFIAIRLALAISFEKHGIQLPLILDDVLVNFDNQRSLAAAKLLLHFAKTGRQVFLFTCHEHICQMFLDMNVPIHHLPGKMEKPKQIRLVLPPKKEPPSKPVIVPATLVVSEPLAVPELPIIVPEPLVLSEPPMTANEVKVEAETEEENNEGALPKNEDVPPEDLSSWNDDAMNDEESDYIFENEDENEDDDSSNEEDWEEEESEDEEVDEEDDLPLDDWNKPDSWDSPDDWDNLSSLGESDDWDSLENNDSPLTSIENDLNNTNQETNSEDKQSDKREDKGNDDSFGKYLE